MCLIFFDSSSILIRRRLSFLSRPLETGAYALARTAAESKRVGRVVNREFQPKRRAIRLYL